MELKMRIDDIISSAQSLGLFDVSDESKIRIVVEGASAGNTVVVRARIRGQSNFTTLATLTGSTEQVVKVFTYEEVEVECTNYASSGSDIRIIAASFNEAGGAAIEEIGVPSGENLKDIEILTLTSSNDSISIVGNNTTKTIDLTTSGASIGYTPADSTDWSPQPTTVAGALDQLADKKISSTEKGAPNGVAPLNSISKIDSLYLPSYVDDVVEYPSLAAFPPIGETGKIYVALNTNLIYRWSGSTYVEVSSGNDRVLKAGDTMTGQLVMRDTSILVDYSITNSTPTSTFIGNDVIQVDIINGDVNSRSSQTAADIVLFRTDSTSPESANITISSEHNAPILEAIITNTETQLDTHLTIDSAAVQYDNFDNSSNTSRTGYFGAGAFDIQTTFSSGSYVDIQGDTSGISMTAFDGIATTSPLLPTLPEHVAVKKYVDDRDALKENLSNKTTDGTLSANSDTLYPSEKAVKTYVDATSGVATANFDASTYYHELHVNYDFTGATSDGSPYKPFKTVQDAVNAAQLQSIGGNTAILIHLKKDITMVENIVVNNAPSNLYIMPAVRNNTASAPFKIIGSLTISGSATTRVRVQDIEFAPTSGYALIINDTNGRHLFQNCGFVNGSVAGQAGTGVTLTSTYKNFIEFVDCTIEGTVNIDGTPSAGTTVTMYRSRLTYANLIVNSANVAVGMYDTYGIYGVTHTAGALAITGMWGLSQTGFFNSTASLSGINFLSIANASLQKPDLSFVAINKTGTCPYQLINVHRGETSDVLSGGRLVYGPTATDSAYKMGVSGNWSPAVSNVAGALDQLAANKISTSQKGAANGVAPLNASSKVDYTYLPDDLNDVLEYTNLASFPATGVVATIYIAKDTNKTYRWTGSAYVEIGGGSGGGTWGTITGTLSNQTDLQAALDAKVNMSVLADEKEPTGFITRTDSTISFVDSSRIFTIAPTSTSFSFYLKGVKYTKTTAQNLTIPNLVGNHYIYFNASGVLESTQTFTSDIIESYAVVAIVYWNNETTSHTYFAEERHGMTMDGSTHSYLHTILGARYLSGLALQNFTIGNGNSNADAQFTSDSGSIRDEDIIHVISAQTQIPILYRQGQYWRKKAADAYPLIYSGSAGYTGANGRPAYNQYTGGAWQLTEMSNTNFILMHFFATNDVDNKVVGIVGTQQYNNINAARTGANSEISALSDLPFAEFVPIGSVIFQSNNYTNAVKARVVQTDTGANYVDFRGTQVYTPAGQASDHGLLSGLSDDDHIQYLNIARGDARYLTKSAGDIAETSFSIANNQASVANITGLLFPNSSVRSFTAKLSVLINATTSLYETFELEGIQTASNWSMSIASQGDNSGITLSITSSGQVQYQSSNYSGFVSGIIKFRAITTT